MIHFKCALFVGRFITRIKLLLELIVVRGNILKQMKIYFLLNYLLNLKRLFNLFLILKIEKKNYFKNFTNCEYKMRENILI